MQLEANKRVFVTTLFRGVNTQSHKKLWSDIAMNFFKRNCFVFKTRMKSNSQKFDYFVSVNLSSLNTTGVSFLPVYTLSYLHVAPPEL